MPIKRIALVSESGEVLSEGSFEGDDKAGDAILTGTRVLSENFNSRKTIILNEGGARSSKSYSIAQLIIFRFLSEQNKKFLICRKYMRSLKYSVFRTFMEVISRHRLNTSVKINKTMMEFTSGSNYLLMTSVDDPVKLQSTEFNYIWMEEAEEFMLGDYLTLKTRLSSPQNEGKLNQIFLSYNPKKKGGYVNKVVKLEDDVEIIKSSYRDNSHLNPAYLKLLESIKQSSPEYYNTFALGEYSNDDEQVYKHIKLVPEFPVFIPDERIYGLDFGYNNPTALVQIDIKDKVYYVTELLYEKFMTNGELIEKLKGFGIKPDDYIYADSSEPARIEEIRMADFSIQKSNKSLGDGIDMIKSIEIFSLYKNENFNDELENYSYKKSSQGRLFEVPEKDNDHLMDAMRYAIYTHSKRVVPNVRFF